MIGLLLAAHTLVAVESKVPNIPVWLRNAPFLEEVGSCDFIAEYIGERKADKYVFGTLYLHEPRILGVKETFCANSGWRKGFEVGLLDIVFDFNRVADGWRLSEVLDGNICRPVAGRDWIYSVDAKPCPALRFADAPSVTGHFLRGQEGSPDEHNTDGSDDGHDGRYYEHTKRPKRHFTLSHHVAFGSMMLVGGLYYALYAFRAGSRIKAEAAALYVLLGMVGVGVGVCTILAFGFAY